MRWTRMEGLHLTLKFLGDIARNQVEPIVEVLHNIAQQHPPFHLVAQGVGVFPHVRRPRVVWVGLTGDGVVALREAIDTALMPLDFPPEERAFTPILTLGRVRSPRGWDRVVALLKEHEHRYFGECTIDSMTLYQSDRRPDGAVYTPLASVSFRQHL